MHHASLNTRYVASRHLVTMPLEPPWHYVSHALLGSRRVYQQDAMDFISLFQDRARTPLEAAEEGIRRGHFHDPGPEARTAWHENLVAFVLELLRGHLLVAADVDEDAMLREHISARWGPDPLHNTALAAMEDVFAPVVPTALAGARKENRQPVSFVLLGWCFTQSVAPVLVELAAAEGLDARVTVGFHQDLHLFSSEKPDVGVLQLSHRMVLAPLMDGIADASADERALRTEQAVALVEASIRDARAALEKGLLLVQGIALPQTSPLGMREYREAHGLFACLHRVNAAAAAACAERDDMLFIDEDRLLSNHGKCSLLDDLVSTYSHHGALASDPVNPDATDRLVSFGLKDRGTLYRLLAREYLSTWQAWTARDAIRVIAVDLDNTLWPGNVGDEGFTFDSDDMTVALMYGRHGGLHEALRILRNRGVLLVAVSKNSRDQVLEKWHMERVPLAFQADARDTRHYLVPDDFVQLKISWEPKSRAITELLSELGVTARQVCFIDDHPVERAEVAAAHPDVMILGEDMNRVREVLLTHPRLDAPRLSDEAKHRTATTRARLQREEARAAATDPAAFLRTLQVHARVERLRDPGRVPRVVELLARTNQFNTSLRRLGVDEVTALLQREDADIFTMSVTDRFADYGLVGAAVMVSTELSVFAMSCRVLGLEAERALLDACMRSAASRGRELRVPFVNNGERNQPARRLFQLPGFVSRDDGTLFTYDVSGVLPALPEHLVVVRTDSSPS